MAVKTRGLSAEDLAKIRTGLDAGRRPRVLFTAAAGQIAGQLGQVVALTDPATSDEFVVVRFGRDELPFSPGDLQIPPRGATARGKPAAAPAPPKPPEPEFLIDKPPAPSARRKPPAPANGHAVQMASPESPARNRAGAARSDAAASSGRKRAGQPPPDAPPGEEPAVEPSARRAHRQQGSDQPAPTRNQPARRALDSPAAGKESAQPVAGVPAPAPRKQPGPPAPPAARRSKAKPPPGLTVTLAYTDGEWTVAAAQGNKTLARPYVIKPAEAMRMVALVDVPGVHEAVEQIVAAERTEAEQQAERLRSELAEVESRLAELREVQP